jgi:hypothetical protein
MIREICCFDAHDRPRVGFIGESPHGATNRTQPCSPA